MTPAAVAALRNQLGLRVSGVSPPRPCVAFAHFGLDAISIAVLQRLELATPTPIQAQVRGDRD
jgi:ATP-dependent RNA helicase DDX42